MEVKKVGGGRRQDRNEGKEDGGDGGGGVQEKRLRYRRRRRKKGRRWKNLLTMKKVKLYAVFPSSSFQLSLLFNTSKNILLFSALLPNYVFVFVHLIGVV